MATAATLNVEVDLPQLVLRLVEDAEYDENYVIQTFTEQVKVGDVVVFERKYSDGFEAAAGRDNYAYDQDEARDKALNELGEKLKNLLGE